MEPTFDFSRVNGINREYTLNNPNGVGTLYYTTSPTEEAPAVGSAAYTSAAETSKTISYSESGKYYAYVLHTNGSTTSGITTQTVTAGALTLKTPVFTEIDMVKNGDYYYPKVSFASDNSMLEGTPTATLSIASPYTFTSTGSITVTASADGYTSSSATYTVKYKYDNSKTIDFGALTAEDFDEKWTSATGAPRDYWTKRGAAIPADVTYYKLVNTSSILGDPDNSAVLDGITITNYHQRVPEVYIGYGLLTPYTAISGSGNNMTFKVNGGTANDFIIYNGWNNYGNGTFNTLQTGDATFYLYRYDTMLRTINVYSPVMTMAPISSSTGYATFSSTYALDFSEVTGLTAYTATACDGTNVTLTPVSGTVAANTGLVIKGETTDIPVVATGDAQNDNLMKPCDGSWTTLSKSDTGTNYVLSVQNSIAVFAPIGEESATLRAGSAYLYVPTSGGARALNIVFDEDATGIASVKSESNAVNGYYNLAGQRIAQPTKGLYIVNGKKVVIK